MPRWSRFALLGLLWGGVSHAQQAGVTQAPAIAAPVQAVCPPGKSIAAPYFPPAMARDNRSGTVVLDLEVDECGRVTNAHVLEGNRKEFNEASLTSVKGTTLSAAQLAKVVNGHYRHEIVFNEVVEAKYEKLDWPKTHKRPVYLADDHPTGFATAKQASEGIPDPTGKFWPSPYPVKGSRFVQMGETGAREFWYFLDKDGAPWLAVRYRPVMENNQAIVRLTLLCDDVDTACAEAKTSFMKGLPYAKAQNP